MKACVAALVLSLVASQALAGCPFAEQAAAEREGGVSRKLKDKKSDRRKQPARTTKPATAPSPAPATLKPAAATSTPISAPTATTAPAPVPGPKPGAGASLAPKNCSAKQKFDLLGIYGSETQVPASALFLQWHLLRS